MGPSVSSTRATSRSGTWPDGVAIKIEDPAQFETAKEKLADLNPVIGGGLVSVGARAYDVTRPDNPVWVDVSVRAHPLGAYEAGPVTHVMISSVDQSYRGYAALEMLFHERSHAWGGVPARAIFAAAQEQGVSVPPQLAHAVLFYTAGELTARELKSHGIDYTHYAHPGIYTNMCGASCEARMAIHWTPHLEGKRSIVESLSGLVATFK